MVNRNVFTYQALLMGQSLAKQSNGSFHPIKLSEHLCIIFLFFWCATQGYFSMRSIFYYFQLDANAQLHNHTFMHL